MPCKECPWVIRNGNNDRFIGYAKKHKLTHNCHMIPVKDRGQLWSTKEGCQCDGNKQYLETIK